SPEQESDERKCNYERYRGLVQNDFAGISEEQCLYQIYIDELYGGLQKPNEDEKKKLAEKKASIGYTYEDSTVAELENSLEKRGEEEDSEEDSNTDEDEVIPDIDVEVDVDELNQEQVADLNKQATTYGMAEGDFVRRKDKEEAEAIKNAKALEEEKAMYSGRRSRRQRREFREKRLKGRKISPPSYARRDSPTYDPYKRTFFLPYRNTGSGWRYAQNVTVDEIMTAYKQACQKLNCKQIPKLLKQIQEFKDLAPRIDCLDLKGEKLDYKACEALEEIFKRVQFKIVDLEQTSLDEDLSGWDIASGCGARAGTTTHLNISFNKHIGTRGWQAAAHMMRKTNCLQYLDARNTPLLDHSAPFVARALRISSSLVVLHLENASLSGRPLMLLATALKMNMNLRELYLADNKLNGLQDSAQLGNLLKFNCYIQILDLRNNHILDSGIAKQSQPGLQSRLVLVSDADYSAECRGLVEPRSARALPAAFGLGIKVKSFIETQKALLAEIQNGCKRNFILAKEKEEKEQKLQQSASMPEITVTEPLEEGPAEDGRDGSAAS
ncbi:PREDICTED: uncharacterized protein LOC103921364, partial [Pygoscelis adeliae]|uniref:uncharacterized protein LOC103921364 n=1 Tax=Pygoscelis adeliae TaxID=9238 RepID=UPI0004F4E700